MYFNPEEGEDKMNNISKFQPKGSSPVNRWTAPEQEQDSDVKGFWRVAIACFVLTAGFSLIGFLVVLMAANIAGAAFAGLALIGVGLIFAVIGSAYIVCRTIAEMK